MSGSLEGKVAVITGSGQGVGRGIALFFAREGAKVITNNRKPGSFSAAAYTREDIPEEEFKKMLTLKGDAGTTAEQIKNEGGEATPFYGDISDYDTAGALIQMAMDTYGRIDILVNNAAGLGQGTIINTSESDWDYMTMAKMKGAFNTMSHAVPHMIRQKSGRILNCASDAWVGISNLCAYSAGNAGVVGLTKASAKELADHNITVNAYCPQADSPGHVVEFNKAIRALRTALGDQRMADTDKMREVEADHGDPVNMAPFLAYLCTEEAGFISGSVFSVKASGKIDIYSEPVILRQIKKTDSPWTVEELKNAVPGELLADYRSRAFTNPWG